MAMALPAKKFRILVIQILVKMKLNAKSLVLENMTASVLQEQVASTAKKRMPVPPILAKIMANVFKLKKAASNAFARMDTLVQTANFLLMGAKVIRVRTEELVKVKTERWFASVKASLLDQLVKNVDVQKETPRQILLFSHRNVTPKVIATVKMDWI